MNYAKIYNDLISRGKSRNLTIYTEKHHIIPRCMGGDDSPNNLVSLTPEEHYIAHQLLVKMYPGNGALVRAAQMMTPGRPNNKLYGWLRRRFSEEQKKSMTGEGNSRYGSRWIHNLDIRESKSISKEAPLPEGWREGRIIDFDNYFKKIEDKEKIVREKEKKKIRRKIRAKHHKFRKSEEYRKAKAIKLYNEFKHTTMSLRSFAKSKNIVPMTLSNWFREFITEYDVEPRRSASKQICRD